MSAESEVSENKFAPVAELPVQIVDQVTGRVFTEKILPDFSDVPAIRRGEKGPTEAVIDDVQLLDGTDVQVFGMPQRDGSPGVGYRVINRPE